ncbi:MULTISPECIES: hypothetical protein [unclassified Shinella]|uniref:hypothetical protein n=1 Tax=unclassified Shinella TaxID=2643062 RepID=UPI00234F448B|nr:MULTISPECIES: hypothetical protein [unclassified Shinella]MCO5153404.1 hypothetical protein [Shinella sp.]MDC7260583.1 hypothetical protein [Shinella sp. HY16]MDC7267478.1 hypothetical protein [Shinella sp. YZ44]
MLIVGRIVNPPLAAAGQSRLRRSVIFTSIAEQFSTAMNFTSFDMRVEDLIAFCFSIATQDCRGA